MTFEKQQNHYCFQKYESTVFVVWTIVFCDLDSFFVSRQSEFVSEYLLIKVSSTSPQFLRGPLIDDVYRPSLCCRR